MGAVTNTALVDDLRRDSTALINISNLFVSRGKDLITYTFFETQKVSGVLVRICSTYATPQMFGSTSAHSWTVTGPLSTYLSKSNVTFNGLQNNKLQAATAANSILEQVVDEPSARIGLPNEKLFPVDADHRTICKFPAADSQAYKGVGPWIVTLVREASVERLALEVRLATMQ